LLFIALPPHLKAPILEWKEKRGSRHKGPQSKQSRTWETVSGQPRSVQVLDASKNR